jgi:hypothetical protein
VTRTILLDMDGVIVDFVKAACEAHGKPNPYEHGESGYDMPSKMGMTDVEFWGGDLAMLWWWAELPWTADGAAILVAAKNFVGKDNIYLATSPTLAPGSCSGKLLWVQKNLPEYQRRLMIGPCKYLMARPDHILIDDSDANVTKFREAGGHAILVPRPWNSGTGDPIERVLDELRRIVQ